MNRKGPIEILLVEDSAMDANLIDRSLEEGSVQKNVHTVGDGVDVQPSVNQVLILVRSATTTDIAQAGGSGHPPFLP